jgi:hypothetical protein
MPEALRNLKKKLYSITKDYNFDDKAYHELIERIITAISDLMEDRLTGVKDFSEMVQHALREYKKKVGRECKELDVIVKKFSNGAIRAYELKEKILGKSQPLIEDDGNGTKEREKFSYIV